MWLVAGGWVPSFLGREEVKGFACGGGDLVVVGLDSTRCGLWQ